eukprot:scaffold34994_cov63-Phaeocystis_antarctica.AAC.1
MGSARTRLHIETSFLDLPGARPPLTYPLESRSHGLEWVARWLQVAPTIYRRQKLGPDWVVASGDTPGGPRPWPPRGEFVLLTSDFSPWQQTRAAQRQQRDLTSHRTVIFTCSNAKRLTPAADATVNITHALHNPTVLTLRAATGSSHAPGLSLRRNVCSAPLGTAEPLAAHALGGASDTRATRLGAHRRG